MRPILVTITFLLCSLPGLADQITQMGAEYGVAISPPFQWFIRIPDLVNPNSFQKHHFGGGGTTANATLVCAGSCDRTDALSFNLTVSGLYIKNGEFNGTVYPVIYFSGLLNLDATRNPHSFPVHIFGTLTGCSDPQCNIVLFPLSVDLRGRVVNYSIGQDASGNFILASAQFQAPEPSSLALVATGLAGVIMRWGRNRLIPV